MTRDEADYYILPSTWCDTCKRQISCDVVVWEVAEERVATFSCPGCGQTLGVGLHGETAWTPRQTTARQRRGADR